MKNRKLIFGLVILAFSLSFIGGGIGESAAYTLNGTVEYKGQPISGIKVVLGGDNNSEITTGQYGTYSFNFGEGSYTVKFYSDDYLFDRQGFAFKVFNFIWTGGPSGGAGGSNVWGSGSTMTANWKASFPLQSQSGIAYTGIITEATVDTTNAKELAVISYIGGSYSNIGQPRLTRVPPNLSHALTLMNIEMDTSDSGTISGDCGGTSAYTVDSDSQDNFSGTAVFNNFCYEGMVISGTVNFSGVNNAGGFIKQEFIFDPIRAHSEHDEFELSGDITNEFDDPYWPVTITSNLFVRDTQTSKIYVLTNYLIQGGAYTDGLNFIIGGRLYHPDFGYVILSQATHYPASYSPFIFKIPTGEVYPSEGGLTVRGGSNTAKLSAVSSDAYKIEIEITQDAIYDIDLGTLFWSDLYLIKAKKAMPWLLLLLLDD